MKKTVLAFAVAAAMGVPAVAAADTTLYGRFHVSVDRADSGATGSSTANQMNSRASRIGVRGSEDLGGGLRGVFQAEWQMDPTEGDAFTTTRDSFVGLAGDFGAVHLGTTNNVYERVIGTVQVFGDSIIDARQVLAGAPGDVSLRGRPENSIYYQSPNFSGIQLSAHYGLGEQDTGATANKDDQISLGVTYRQGPLQAFGAYTKKNEAGPAEQKGFIIGGAYTIDDLRLGLAYDRVENQSNSRNAYLISARYSIGQAFLMGMYGDRGEFVPASRDGFKYYGVGAGYNFSRRTSAYAAYAKRDGDAAGSSDPSAISFGIQHDF